MRRDLQGLRILITGASGGIGRALAEQAVAAGARVALAARSTDKLADLAATLKQRGGVAVALPADITVEADRDALLHGVVEQLGGLDVLYHVAGSSGRRHGDGPLHECTDEGWQATLDANLKSTFLTNRAAVRQFLLQGVWQSGAEVYHDRVVVFSVMDFREETQLACLRYLANLKKRLKHRFDQLEILITVADFLAI